jgi:hypothetical protein
MEVGMVDTSDVAIAYDHIPAKIAERQKLDRQPLQSVCKEHRCSLSGFPASRQQHC